MSINYKNAEANANLVEIFSSIQGEGPYIGVRQVFLRFAECNLKCSYCDTEHKTAGEFRVEMEPGSARFYFYNNPAKAGQVAEILNNIGLNNCHSISLTGGEPLLNTGFIKALSENIKNLKKQTGTPFLYLETNGTLPDKLTEVIQETDIISMDIKLPSVYGGAGLWNIHREFAEIASQKELFVKVVIAENSTNEEIIATFELVSMIDRNIPVVIQPLSPHKGFEGEAPKVSKLLAFQELGMKYLNDVRVIPQSHKMLGCL